MADNKESETMKTGTTTLGIMCKDGIILAADMRATSGNFIVTKRISKIYEIADGMAITMAGTVSDAQLLVKLIQAELRLKDVRTNRKSNVKEAANMLAGMIYGNIRKFSVIPGISHFLLGGKDVHEFSLYDLFADGSLTKVDDFISTGSGSVFAYGVLETTYTKDLTVDQAQKLAVKAINAALQRDSASGGGIQVVAITHEGVKIVFSREVEQTVRV
ncbi:proteasome subunit beta [Candidatus Woesearchaeota archaeon]|nr:proteasome subunit beta [Candidatus Woesearchaeota archaeon]